MLVRQGRIKEAVPVMELVRRAVPLMRANGNLQWDAQYPNAAVFERDVEKAQLWMAKEEQGQILGFAAITTDQEPEDAEVGWDTSELAVVVHRLAVDPSFQGERHRHGLDASGRGSWQEGVESGILRVDTNTQNEATQRLFPKLGYSLAGDGGLGFRPGLRFCCYEKRLD